MANKKQYIDLKAQTTSNWDSVVLLSLTEIVDKVLRQSQLQYAVLRTQNSGASRDVRRAG
jgi:hypothetical protein